MSSLWACERTINTLYCAVAARRSCLAEWRGRWLDIDGGGRWARRCVRGRGFNSDRRHSDSVRPTTISAHYSPSPRLITQRGTLQIQGRSPQSRNRRLVASNNSRFSWERSATAGPFHASVASSGIEYLNCTACCIICRNISRLADKKDELTLAHAFLISNASCRSH